MGTKKTKKADVLAKDRNLSWAYSKIVKEHFFKPKNFLEKDPKPGEFDAVGEVGSPACILNSTIIHSNFYPQAAGSFLARDIVLAHDGFYYSIKRVLRPAYKTQSLVKLKNQFGEIVATPDHLIYAVQVPRPPTYFCHTSRKKRVPPSWVHAGDLRKGDIILYPVPKVVADIKDLRIESNRVFYDFKSRSLPKKIKLTNGLLELLGYFVAEGHTRRTEVGFTFGFGEKQFVKRAKFLIRTIFGLDSFATERPRNNRIDIVAYNVHLARFLHNLCGAGAQNKHIPEFILHLSPKLQRSFIRGLWRGDGYINTKREHPRAGYATISYTLIQQLKFLLLRQRIAPSIYCEGAKTIRGVHHKESYRIHIGDMTSLEKLARIVGIRFRRDQERGSCIRVWFDENYLYLPIASVCSVPFNGGRLFNLEVDKTHTYTTDAFAVHNCGDIMKIWIKIDPKTERIKKLKWRTFGCASAIASTSVFSVMVTEKGGMKLEKALKIKPPDILKRLGGLPARKIHCSVLADKAFRAAVNNYFRKTGQHKRIIVEGARIIDKDLNITDKDIEEAVLDGATTLNDLQKKLKVGIGNPKVIPDVEQLLRFYKEKYFG